jgi:hypothetical protein
MVTIIATTTITTTSLLLELLQIVNSNTLASYGPRLSHRHCICHHPQIDLCRKEMKGNK